LARSLSTSASPDPRPHPDFEAPAAKTSKIIAICMNSDRKICARSAPTISSKCWGPRGEVY
jgi:hypothetical protein